MPNFVEIENSELIQLKANGGKNLSTTSMKKRTEHVSHFMTFIPEWISSCTLDQ